MIGRPRSCFREVLKPQARFSSGIDSFIDNEQVTVIQLNFVVLDKVVRNYDNTFG